MADPIIIDGSEGEGGGQIVRSSLALSMVTGKPVTLTNIRARRKPSGLRRQHTVAVEAAAEIASADVRGASVDSSRLNFTPGKPRPGDYEFDIGSAGSTTLVAQTILPALITADAPSDVLLRGGTHNPMAPPVDFLERVFLPLLARMGPKVTGELHRPGFFPAGGGEWEFRVEPSAGLSPIELTERGDVVSMSAVAVVSNLPVHVAQRELGVLAERLGLSREDLTVEEITRARGPGNAVMLAVECEHAIELFTGFGQKGVPSEKVAAAVATEADTWLKAEVPVGEHLADQLLLPAAMAAAGGGSSTFVTMPLTDHSRTNMAVIERFLPVRFDVKESRRQAVVKVLER